MMVVLVVLRIVCGGRVCGWGCCGGDGPLASPCVMLSARPAKAGSSSVGGGVSINRWMRPCPRLGSPRPGGFCPTPTRLPPPRRPLVFSPMVLETTRLQYDSSASDDNIIVFILFLIAVLVLGHFLPNAVETLPCGTSKISADGKMGSHNLTSSSPHGPLHWDSDTLGMHDEMRFREVS